MASCTFTALPIISNPTNSSSPTLPWRLNPHSLATSLFGRKLSIRLSTSRRFVSKHQPAIATVLSSLPTLYVKVLSICMLRMYMWDVLLLGLGRYDLFAYFFSRKPERASSEKTPKWVNFNFVCASVRMCVEVYAVWVGIGFRGFLWVTVWASGDVIRWSSRAIKSFAMAELEARKLKYPNTGTEAILMGILVEG